MQPGRRPSRLVRRRDCAAERAPQGDGDTAIVPSLPNLHLIQQTQLRILATYSSELCFIVSPSNERGRREDRVPAGTRGPLCEVVVRNLHSGIQVKPNIRPSLRGGFTAYVALSPGSDALLPPSPCGWLMRGPGRAATSPQRLTPACGRQDHTILPYADHTGRTCDVPRSRFPALRSPSHRCGPRPPPSGPRS
ncbi:hypothetical protein FHR88_001439 [Bradyrhizobium betae]|nr:hypothetical protein [Bradyrhizobium betae]